MSDSTEGRRPIDPAAHGSTPAASMVEVHPRFLDESGLSLSDAAGSDLLLTVVTSRAESLVESGLARLTRRSAPPRTVPLTDAPVPRIAAARARDPKSLLVVHQRAETPDAIVDDLVGAGADLVITTGAHESSISSVRGRAVVRLTAYLSGSAPHEGDEETLQWDLQLSRTASAKNRLLLHLDARAVTQRGGRPLTSDETARIYTDALQDSDRMQQFLELVEGSADETAGHLTVDLTASGALELPPPPAPTRVRAVGLGGPLRTLRRGAQPAGDPADPPQRAHATRIPGEGAHGQLHARAAFRHHDRLLLQQQPPRTGVLVERHVSGVEARFMVVGDTCVSVSCACPPRIVGEGRQTIRQLITALNDVRRGNPLLVSRPLVLNGDRIERLRAHGFPPPHRAARRTRLRALQS